MTKPEIPENICLIRGGVTIPLDAVYAGVEDGQHIWDITTPIDVWPTDRITIDVMPAHTTIRFPAEPPPPSTQRTRLAGMLPWLGRTPDRTDLAIMVAVLIGTMATSAGLSQALTLVFTPGPGTVVAGILLGIGTGLLGFRLIRWLLTTKQHGR